MKHLATLLLAIPLLLLACTAPVVEVSNTAVPPTSLPEPTAQPTDVPVVEESSASEEAAVSAETETASEATYAVDTSASTLTWTGAKIGQSHTGTINLSSGQLVVMDNALLSGSFEIDMATLREGSVRLEDHLKSDDFFGVESFPTASVEILEVVEDSAENYTVRANLTIKEITNEISFPATATISDGTLTASASMTFDRSLWDVRYGSGSFFDDLGNDLINDEIEMVVELVAAE